MSAPSPPAWRRLASRLSPAVGRTRGEWVTDSALFVFAVLVSTSTAWPGANPQIPAWWWPWDIALGALAAASIWWTRRYPLAVGILLIIPAAVALTAVIGVLVSVYRMALLAPVVAALLVTGIQVTVTIPYYAYLPLPGMPWIVWLIVVALLYALSLCIGFLGRARRQLIVGLRATAARDRERYEERLSTARRDERERIAREMHDVLAHRISLLSIHAGALEYRATSPKPPGTGELRDAARVIRENAHGAVEDLRELLGLLRSDDELATAAPQPRLADLELLLADAATAGQLVRLHSDANAARLRETTQRTAYRIVQEALTNARKHAPHALVTVQLTQDRTQLTITASNPLPPGVTREDASPAGNGLIGLEERVHLESGRFHATIEEGEFRVRAELPLGGK